MNGQIYSLPLQMIFKKYYCAKCGAKLEKEKTHRVVTKDDRDYYRYHSYGKFPRRDYDVYDHRLKCPSCGMRISFAEQCITEITQKKQGHKVLSSGEIKSNYNESKQIQRKKALIGSVLCPTVILLAVFVLFCVANAEMDTKHLISAAALFLAMIIITVVGAIRRYQGKGTIKSKYAYPYEKEEQLKRLHTYSSHNRNLVLMANRCCCFCCQRSMDSREIQHYTNNGQTALCPKCGIDSIIPDSVGESIDQATIAEMHEYWF